MTALRHLTSEPEPIPSTPKSVVKKSLLMICETHGRLLLTEAAESDEQKTKRIRELWAAAKLQQASLEWRFDAGSKN